MRIIDKTSQLYPYRLRHIGVSALSFLMLLTVMILPVYKTEIHAKNTDEVTVCLQRNNCGEMCSKTHPMSHM